MEELIQFSYKGKQYTGNILSSLDMTPHYYWVVFRQPELKAILGEEITFIVKDAMLKPVNTFLAQKNRELFQQIQSAMEKHLTVL